MRRVSIALAALVLVSLPVASKAQTIQTVAGGSPTNLPALAAEIGNAAAVALDKAGNYYVVSSSLNQVFRVTPTGAITTVAGNGTPGFSGDGGPATLAELNYPYGVAVDGSGNLYIADFQNVRIRMVNPSGVITTVAGNGVSGFSGDGGSATSAQISSPVGVAVDGKGNLYFADFDNNRIRMVNSSGVISTVAGNGIRNSSGDGGPATSAELYNPSGVALDGNGNLYIAGYFDNRIRMVNTSGIITTVAGNGTPGFSGDGGPATSAELYYPSGVAVDGQGNIYIGDLYNNRIRMVNASGVITTVAGNGTAGFSGDGGPATSAELNMPAGVAVDGNGNFYIADTNNNRVRMVNPSGMITTVAGHGSSGFGGDGGPAKSAELYVPYGVAVDGNGNLYIADTDNNRIRVVNSSAVINTFAGNGNYGYGGDGNPATSAKLADPTGIAIDGSENLYIADTNNNRIRMVTPSGVISTVAGSGTAGFSGDGGPATSAELSVPAGVAMDGIGNLYIADTNNDRIRMVTPSGVISTVAGDGTAGFSGDGGPATSAELNVPTGVAVDRSRNLYIADTNNSRIRMVTPSGVITTVAGNGFPGYGGDGGIATSAPLYNPFGVAVDGRGLVIADVNNQRIRLVNPSGLINTVAGIGNYGFSGDGGPPTSAQLADPSGVALDGNGNLFIADRANNSIREVTFAPISITPVSLTFPVQTVGTSSAPQIVTISNNRSQTLQIPSITVPTGFSETDNCIGSLAGLSACAVNVTFSPVSTGLQSGDLTINNSGATGAFLVPVAGTAIQPKATLSTTSLQFSAQVLGATSAPQTITITNDGSDILFITKVTITGDFAQTNSCEFAFGINAGSLCTISVTFTPTAAGTRSGTITITDNAAGSPQSVALAGGGNTFALAPAPSSSTMETVAAGTPASFNLQVQAPKGSTITLAADCSGVPASTSCMLSTQQLQISGAAPVTFSLSVGTTASSQLFPLPRLIGPFQRLKYLPVAAASMLLLFLAAVSAGRVKDRQALGTRLAFSTGLMLLTVVLASCGGGSTTGITGTPPGTYTAKVTATSQGASEVINLTIVVH